MQERADRNNHREWIGGRAITLLNHYWRDDDPAEMTGAIGQDWADVLEGMPQDAIQKACIKYQRDEPRRKPTPGAIYALARSYIPKPSFVPKPSPEPERREPSAEERKRVAELVASAGFTPKRFGEKS